MGDDEAALLRLWQEKRGEAEPEDLSGNLIVQLGVATEGLNRRWYEANTGQVITDVQRQIRHPGLRWMAATLDGRVEASGRYSRPSSCCLVFSEEAAAEKYMPQLQHNMWVVAAIERGDLEHNRRREVGRDRDPRRSAYQHLIVTAERKSGAASRAASRLPSSASTRRSHGSRQCASSI